MSLPDPDKAVGQYAVKPVASFYENGYFWSINEKYKLHVTVWPGKAKIRYLWSFVDRELNSLGIKSPDQERPCKCKKCITGRKRVRKGWKPNKWAGY